MPRDWQAILSEMTWTQQLVHLSYRMTALDVDRIRTELLSARRRFYTRELEDQAERVGCPGRSARLTTGPSLTVLSDLSERDAASIVNTFNYDLAAAIIQVFDAIPTANRYIYAYHLNAWESKREEWKRDQIDTYTEMTARSLAQQDFYRFNPQLADGYALLTPTRAVCPVCQGWVKRGRTPIRVAEADPPPYHVNCCLPKTMVMCKDWVGKPIGEIWKGDTLISRHGFSSVIQTSYRTIVELVYHLSVGGRVLSLTGEHPVLTEGGWRPAQEIKVGERVVTPLVDCATEMSRVDKVGVRWYRGIVFNLQTSDEEFIADGVVVHNCPHTWSTRPNQVANKRECAELWLGE